MKKGSFWLVLPTLFFQSSLSASARLQEIFDLLGKGDVPVAKALVEKSPSLVDARDKDGNTPLHFLDLGHPRHGRVHAGRE